MKAARTRGFTLIELMVAITGGLFMSIIVFMMARDGARFYQRASRVADATLANVVGFERLRNDISRAAFMSSPNVQKDPRLCQKIDSTWPAGLRDMAGVRIAQKGSPANSTLSANKIYPDQIFLSGSYDSVDEFPMWGVTDSGSTYTVSLQSRIGPLARMGYETSTQKLALLQSVFKPGRALRLVDRAGKVQYGTIQSVNAGGTAPAVILSHTPNLVFRTNQATACGIRLNETGYVNVVNFVRYDVRSMVGDARYAPLYADNADVPGEKDRTELVRTELDTSGSEILNQNDNTQEIVAEYAVDLQFGVTVVSNITNGTDPALTTFAPGNGQISNYAGDTAGGNTLPQRIRVVRARMSVRSREADRDSNVADPGAGVPFPTGVAPGLYRIAVGNDGTTKPFARVRTLQADISLPNQMGVLW